MRFLVFLGSFPLSERNNVYLNKWQAWIPATLLAIVAIILVTGFLVFKLLKKIKTKQLTPPKPALADIKANALDQINKILENLSANSISEQEAAELLSYTCRYFTDQIYATKATHMTLSEMKRKKMVEWINRIIEYCYAYEFSGRKIEKDENLLSFIESVKKDIELWH